MKSRRELLLQGTAGFAGLALAHLLRDEPSFAAGVGPLAPRAAHVASRAKNAIFLFMEGGPSHLDLFDPKPELNRRAGQSLPASFERVITSMGEFHAPLLASQRRWRRHGQCGTWVSDWLPNIAECVDDIAVLRSCWCNAINHSAGVCQMNTGSTVAGRPSLGSWVTYGLGTENQNLPAFVVMQDSAAPVTNGPRNWGAGFMPAVYQGVRFQSEGTTIPNLHPPGEISSERQRAKLDLLGHLNREHAALRQQQSELEARIASYELAFRMQSAAPEAVDLAQETAATQRLYGMDRRETAGFGRLCLMARRLVERGVRFVQLYHGAGSKWDAHSKIETNHAANCLSSDKPIAGLLKDLKQRGLLDTTLVIWGGEFGRTPMSEKGDGRDHNPYGFTMWLAGGGVPGGRVLGRTDDFGLHAVEDRLHIHDLHATFLRLLGLDHMRLIYRYMGRPERPTVNEGEVYRKVVSA